MVTLIFDKGLETERRLALDSFHEQPLRGSFSGTYSARVERAEDVPELREITDNPAFFALDAVNGAGVPIRIAGTYDRISFVGIAYEDTQKRYTVSLTLAAAGTPEQEVLFHE